MLWSINNNNFVIENQQSQKNTPNQSSVQKIPNQCCSRCKEWQSCCWASRLCWATVPLMQRWFSKKGGKLISSCKSDPSLLLLFFKAGLQIYVLPPTLLNVNANSVGWPSPSSWWGCAPFCCLPLFFCQENWLHQLLGLAETFLYFFASGVQTHQRRVKLV